MARCLGFSGDQVTHFGWLQWTDHTDDDVVSAAQNYHEAATTGRMNWFQLLPSFWKSDMGLGVFFKMKEKSCGAFDGPYSRCISSLFSFCFRKLLSIALYRHSGSLTEWNCPTLTVLSSGGLEITSGQNQYEGKTPDVGQNRQELGCKADKSAKFVALLTWQVDTWLKPKQHKMKVRVSVYSEKYEQKHERPGVTWVANLKCLSQCLLLAEREGKMKCGLSCSASSPGFRVRKANNCLNLFNNSMIITWLLWGATLVAVKADI